jgi:4-diphosphocytidyl-2-C-methyl-D-erythritol kinase
MSAGAVSLRLAARARAKVNLTLAVVGRRADGYHELDSIFLRIGLADRLSVEVAPHARPSDDPEADGLTVLGDEAALCPPVTNLVLRATRLLRSHALRSLPPLTWTLHKGIPVAAGLGGGSSDAALALELALTAWGQGLTQGERHALATELGSDVPFFAADVPAARVTGRGEHVAPLPPPAGGLGLLLAVLPGGLATGDVFAAFDELEPGGGGARDATADLGARLAEGAGGALLAAAAGRLRDANDLLPAALAVRPELAELRAALERRLGVPFLLSGSGPALLALYASGEEAAAALERLAGQRATLPAGTRLEATSAA